MKQSKSEHNPCPVCGKPRGKGEFEFAHGKCAEEFAKAADMADAITPAGCTGDFSRITVEQRNRAKKNSTAKNYRSGKKLPPWMFS